MTELSAWGATVAGMLVGGACGFTVRRARLCSFGAIEDAWMGGDTRRLRIFGLALAVALAGAQSLIGLGLLDPVNATYVQPALPWLSIAIGSTMFGLGMALVGTCSFGSLVRLGAGDLRSLIVMMVFGSVAYATLRGMLAPLRIEILERVAWPVPGGLKGDLASMLAYLGAPHPRLAFSAAAVTVLVAAVAADARLRRSPRLLVAGLTLGLAVVAGWWVTGVAVDAFDHVPKAQSLTFVSPVGRALYAVLTSPAALLEFGIGTLVGVTFGSFLSALYDREFRWEAFDDDREMRRHLLGAVLMGGGGVLAGGCTIGQGISAGSMLALSWPLAIAGMMIGARIGIAFLMEGSLRGLLRRR
ncbi:MAG: YeeE/YedE family protein [Bosea sp.]|uniref:YeeE/YedE family protein n=1 Tax=unclassified Bosea (in: a-proteobacteria) TaxID=2653178 RepID=UPI00096549BC|nr:MULTISPECIES: YeeE/YedE family protein [unclassified Bosea (in: a-proteobacteria)]MBN9457404.1 YeeE/YedE family protein [Bosea sp. (in: a-proteobacteria)]OJV09616.1 MAG: lipocalin [Bosea sp. 67-29]